MFLVSGSVMIIMLTSVSNQSMLCFIQRYLFDSITEFYTPLRQNAELTMHDLYSSKIHRKLRASFFVEIILRRTINKPSTLFMIYCKTIIIPLIVWYFSLTLLLWGMISRVMLYDLWSRWFVTIWFTIK